MHVLHALIKNNNIKLVTFNTQMTSLEQKQNTHHFLSTILSHFVPVCAAISFFKSPTVSSGLSKESKIHTQEKPSQ